MVPFLLASCSRATQFLQYHNYNCNDIHTTYDLHSHALFARLFMLLAHSHTFALHPVCCLLVMDKFPEQPALSPFLPLQLPTITTHFLFFFFPKVLIDPSFFLQNSITPLSSHSSFIFFKSRQDRTPFPHPFYHSNMSSYDLPIRLFLAQLAFYPYIPLLAFPLSSFTCMSQLI